MNQSCSIGHKDSGIFIENEKKTRVVTLISLVAMAIEIVVGYWSGSMSLLADGWHMASHTLALALNLIVYYLFRHHKFKSLFTFGGGKILSLGGYTSAMILVLISFSMIYESGHRIMNQVSIHYNEAILVAVLGLIINLVCVYILHSKENKSHDHHSHCDHGHHHHHHDHHGHHHHHHHSHNVKDHNHSSAYFHILTDAVTSILAIVALLIGKYFDILWADPFVGVLGGFVVFKWSLDLIKETGKDLLDAHDASIDKEKLIKEIEVDGSHVIDLHLWKLSPHELGCEIIIKASKLQKSSDYRDLIQEKFNIHHLIIEVV